MNDALEQYLREVKRLLPCSAEEKKRCLEELRADIAAFLEHTPGASAEDVYAAFGTPKAIAESFMANTDPEQLSHRMSAKRKLVIGIISILALLAIVVGVLAAVTAYKRQNFYDGYFVETFDEVPAEAETAPSALSTC